MARAGTIVRWLPFVPGLAVLALTGVVWTRLRLQDQALFAGRLEIEQITTRDSIASAIESRVRSLMRLARVFEMEQPARRTWEIEAAMLASDEACQAIEWVDPSLHVRWVVPLQGNEAARDLDLGFEPRRRAALESARDRNAVVISRTIELVQGKQGFFVAVPVYDAGAFAGVILGVFRISDLLGAVLAKPATYDYAIDIYDGADLIYQHRPAAAIADADWGSSTEVDLRGLRWRVRLTPSRALARWSFATSTLALAAGALTALLITALGRFAWTAHVRAGEAEAAAAALGTEMVERRRAEAALQQGRDELEVRVSDRTASLRAANVQLEREIEQRESAQEALRLLVRELDHRVKNTLATVQAVAQQTLAISGSLPEFAAAFDGRLAALARIHRALAEEKLSLAKLIEITVSPYSSTVDGLVIDSAPVLLTPRAVRALGMALHELATNAAKYGAFSVASGRVEIVAVALGGDDDRRLCIDWRESGGPPVASPVRRGLGSTLIDDALRYELGSRAVADYATHGVHWQLIVPMRDVVEEAHAD